MQIIYPRKNRWMNVYVSLDMKKIISQIRIWQTKIRHVKNHLAKHDFILNNKSLEF